MNNKLINNAMKTIKRQAKAAYIKTENQPNNTLFMLQGHVTFYILQSMTILIVQNKRSFRKAIYRPYS